MTAIKTMPAPQVAQAQPRQATPVRKKSKAPLLLLIILILATLAMIGVAVYLFFGSSGSFKL